MTNARRWAPFAAGAHGEAAFPDGEPKQAAEPDQSAPDLRYTEEGAHPAAHGVPDAIIVPGRPQARRAAHKEILDDAQLRMIAENGQEALARRCEELEVKNRRLEFNAEAGLSRRPYRRPSFSAGRMCRRVN